MPREQLGGSASSRGSGSVQRGLCGSGSNSEVLRRWLPEGLSDQEQLRGAGRQLWGEAAARPGARIQQRRPQSKGARTHPRIWPPPGQAEARRAQDNKDAPAQS